MEDKWERILWYGGCLLLLVGFALLFYACLTEEHSAIDDYDPILHPAMPTSPFNPANPASPLNPGR